MFCARCGSRLPDDAAFCPNCGFVLRNTGAVPPPIAGQPVPPGYPRSQTEGRAVASLVLGILALFFSIITGIPAIILGHLSLSSVKKSSGKLSGEGIALAGLILGYISVALVPLLLMIAIPNLARSRIAANQAEAAATVRTLIAGQTTYSTTFPRAGYAPDLATLGPGGPSCASEGTQKNACLLDAELGCTAGTSGNWCTRDQYKYSIIGINKSSVVDDFIITATPADKSAGAMSYCATSDAIVRYHSGALTDAIKTVAECTAWPYI